MPSLPLHRPVATILLRSQTGRDHLGAALLISACLHGAALVWHWQTAPAFAPAASTLEVVLVNAHTPDAPANPTVLAQQSLDGGGDAPRGISASPLPRTVVQSPDEQVLLALQKRRMALEAQQQALLTQLLNAQRVPNPEALRQAADVAGRDAIDQEQQIVSSRIAALQARIAQYNARPEHRFAGPAATWAAYAAYVEAWRQRIEQLGTEHYPAAARGRIYGSLQLSVTIRRDGSLVRILIDRPSEHAILNLAARRIVQLAAPFAPLPDAIARDADVLTITRTWHFTDQQLDTAP